MQGFVRQLVVPEEGQLYQNPNVTLKIDHTQFAAGALFLSQAALIWKPHGGEDGIVLSWTDVAVHAVTNDPQKCVYIMLDFDLVWPGMHERVQPDGEAAEEEEDDADADAQPITEMWLVPCRDNDGGGAEVDKMYQAMTECQLLNPDAADKENLLIGDPEDGEDEDGDSEGENGLDSIDEAMDAEEQMDDIQTASGNGDRFADAD